MKRPWRPAVMAALVSGVIGCAQTDRRPRAGSRLDRHGAASRLSSPRGSLCASRAWPRRWTRRRSHPNCPGRSRWTPTSAGRWPRTGRSRPPTTTSSRSKHRIPQVTALDDPVASNTIFPIPSVAPQYSLMGYNPYNLTLAQQFPWFGTLRLRGEVADRDVQVALAELAAAQLDAVAAVKRAYFDLHAGEKTAAILAENREILEDFHDDRPVAARRWAARSRT